MGFFKKLFGDNEKIVVTDYATFWKWFSVHADLFHSIVKKQDDVEENFLDKIIPVLKQVNEHFFCLVGMPDDDTVEMIITVDGDVKSIVFAEEVVAAAPTLKGW